ncbi:hypothetical protein MYAM1_000900 [Malassezia yamatoensis]|uniref:Thioesterase domain-containing protein n=1 Tax=Malassezia yamatoensis TaxID=253288 RepID=A0AAJ5YQH5_9BASI|nr:hypothetical protein MYAM1_000900 [Malassezia yamatoensis]
MLKGSGVAIRPGLLRPDLKSISRLYTSQPLAHQRNKRSGGGALFWLTCSTVIAGVGYIGGAKFPPPAIPFLFSPYATNSKGLSDEQKFEAARVIEKGLYDLPGVQTLANHSYETASARSVRESFGIKPIANLEMKAEDADYLMIRPFTHIPEERLVRQFTAGSLRGLDMFATTPLVFSKTKRGAEHRGGREGDTIAFIHVGKNLCGYEGVVHGGLVATMFDEVLARAAFYALPSFVGVTAKLEINYRKPTYADRYLMLESHVTDSEGRKAFVAGDMREPGSHAALATADAVFVEPRFAKYLTWIGGLNIRKLMEG